MKVLKRIIPAVILLIFLSCSLGDIRFTGFWQSSQTEGNTTTTWGLLFDTSTFIYIKSISKSGIMSSSTAEGTYYPGIGNTLVLTYTRVNGTEKSWIEIPSFSFSADNAQLTLTIEDKDLLFSRP